MSIPGTASTDSATRKPSQVLDAAADLITPKGAWTQGAGYDVSGPRFCAAGALTRAADVPIMKLDHYRPDVCIYLQRAAGLEALAGSESEIFCWNDAPRRTQAGVVRTLRKAAELARSEGQ